MNIKNIENEMKENNSKSPEINQNSEIITADSDISNKLRNITVSLDNEKTYTCFLKKFNKDKASNNTYKERNNILTLNNKLNTKSKRSTYSQEMTNGSINSNYESIYYPDVYYINEDNNLHTKTHISMFFTKLKNKNNTIFDKVI
jgi:hypothetical protein